MDWKQEWKKLVWIVAVFLAFFWLPTGWDRFSWGIMEALYLAKWYAREHVLLCLVPAFFIAGAIGVFISQASVMKYLGAKANKVLAYGVAAVSGSILAVCSCTVLPLFAGIWRMGAGLGPATAFLYSGPAINVLAIILTARILGLELGIARAVGAISFSVIIGLIMHLIYRKEETEKANGQLGMPEPEVSRPLSHNALFFFVMIGVLVFANWGAPNDWQLTLSDGSQVRGAITKAPEDPNGAGAVYRVKYLEGPKEGTEENLKASEVVEKTVLPGFWTTVWQNKWLVTAVFAVGFAVILIFWLNVAWWKVVLAALPPAVLALSLPSGGLWVLIPFSATIVGLSIVLSTNKGEGGEWFSATWSFAKQILPLLFFGVLVAGFLLGRPDHEGFIPSKYVEMLVGDSPNRMLQTTGWDGGPLDGVVRAVWPLWTNLFASLFGAFMYFATLTEVPILQGLIGSGMGKGPALALLLAGPALSLPNMLVIGSIMGARKTIVFCSLVVVMATISGMIFGAFF
ncbi:MAG: permease [Planctomycetes bacterium]|nr:permease [Planctomycetota bacterium]